MSKKIISILLLVSVIVSVSTITGLYYTRKNLESRVTSNTYFYDNNISGLSKEEVQGVIDNKIQELNSKSLTFKLGSKKENYKISDLGISYTSKDLADKIFEEQKENGLEEIEKLINLDKKPTKYKLETSLNKDIFTNFIKDKFPKQIKEPINSKIEIEGENIKIQSDEDGEEIDFDKLSSVLEGSIERNETEIDVPIKTVKASKTKEDIENMGIKEVISSFSTNLGNSTSERVNNIKLATKAIDGTILAPDEVFDYNKVVGERTTSKGYEMAHVFVNGQIEDGIGGGICQTSTTLYNAALLANLDIVERQNHGLPVAYVDIGRDATVSYGEANFKFKNTTKHYIYIQAKVINKTLVYKIFGTKDNEYEVLLYSEVKEQIEPPTKIIYDNSLAKGVEIIDQEGSYGYRSTTYKVIKRNGEIISKNVLSNDSYKPTEKIIKKGTK